MLAVEACCLVAGSDAAGAARRRVNLFEQAVPGWQSMPIPEAGNGTQLQPSWSWPPPASADDVGFGAEPCVGPSGLLVFFKLPRCNVFLCPTARY